MDKIRLILALCTFFAVFSLSATIDWPRIRVKDGHLLLTVEKDKNISLVTSGAGGIHVNGQDLAHVAKLASNLTSFIQNRVDFYVPGSPEGVKPINIYDQVVLLESGLKNLTDVAVRRPAIQRVNRRLNGLTRRIRRMNILLHLDECNSNPCKNGGTCQDQFDKFMCFCTPEWEGTTCETDVNECVNFAGTDLGCQNGATCINKPGTYECICSNGWNGVHCTQKDNDCATGGTDLCGHGVCVPQGTSVGYRCICDQGWKTDGKNPACTVDVNECDTYPCSKTPLVQCINVPGSFFCGHCPLGYTGNGYHCNDLNECESFNGGCSLNPKVLCVNTPGSRVCGLCPPSYIGDGVTCTYSGGTCGVNNGGCHPLANCKHTPGVISTFVECICPPGYTGNGIGPNGCTFSTYSGDGCKSNPCVHGTCASLHTTDYVCTCIAGYSGKNCNVATVAACASNPCNNGGTCVNTENGYFCKCTADFTGFNCGTKESSCGGRLNSYAGTLEYIPSNVGIGYKHNCAWVIETNLTKVLNITFKKFNVKQSSTCATSWLQIHDGRNSAAHALGRFCGNTFPKNGTFLSTHNNLYVWFKGDSLIAGNGFSFTWMSVDPKCHEEILAKSHGVLKSPGFPGNYPNNRDCVWRLTAPIDKRIEFHFFSLSLEDDANCTKDYISFHSTSNGEPFAIYCNTSHPSPLTAPFHEVYVRFHSDESGQYPGFQIGYSVIAGIPNCGGVYTKESGIIKGEIVPTLDTVTYECEYKIKVYDDMRIKIDFLSFDVIKTGSQCYEELIIYEGSTSESPIVGRYCGNTLPAPYVSLGNELLVLYKTRLSKGFSLKYESVCGGTYTASEGIIASSNYPQSKTAEEDCIYQINRPIGTVINLNIVETLSSVEKPRYGFSQRQPHCQNIEVRDGDNENAPLLGNYCERTPVDVISTHNALWMKVKKSLSDNRRFYMNYTTVEIGCGGILKEKTGTIQSPSHPTKYPNKLKCTWLIIAPINMVIQLSWSNFLLENSYECKYDRVEVYDNNTNSGMGGLIGRYCGNKLPPILLTSSNIMTIVFKTDVSINQDGFVGSYTFLPADSVCGGTYFTPSGILTTPFYPKSYPVNKDCKWVLHVPSGSQIMLKINDFQLEPYANCRYDFLEIRNGATAASPLIGKFCGDTIPKMIPSHANQLFLRFKSDFTRTSKGFNITWSSTSTGCGGILTASRGSIISPHYPEPYDKNTVCIWKISVNAGSIVQLVFADIDLENHVVCRLDYIEIFDGIAATSKSLGRYCNTAHPPTIKSSGNHVLVKFRSDISDQGRGFQLQYSTICNNKVTGYSGVIESPNYPNAYPPDLDCKWEIGVTEGNKINITFSHFDMERSSLVTKGNCEFDFVEISSYNAEYDTTDVLDRLCGSPEYIPPMTINSNSTTIHFVTDNLLGGNGFRLEWHLFGCGGILDRPKGTIETPGYPNAYPKQTRCDWIITLPSPGKSIEITFDKDLHLENSLDCYNDYIEIYNGRKPIEENLIRHFCSTNNVTIITSNGHEMLVIFQSDYSLQGNGFRAQYRTVDSICGGSIVSASGFIMSPNYPKNYDRKTTCEWLITIKENHIIKLFFHDVDLASSCDKTNVRIYDGPGEGYPLLTTVCGSNKPNETFKSSYNHLYVKFQADGFITAKGFRLEFEKVCGGILNTEVSGLIVLEPSEIFSFYSETCEYTIIAPNPTDHVSLTITSIQEESCYFAFVNVYDGYNSSDPLIGNYCEEIPPTLTSSGAALHISTEVPFKASYTTFSSACGGILEHEIGQFGTPNYPNEYPDDIECEWTIKMSPSISFTINFEDFELVQSEFCNEDFVEIRAIDDNNKLLGDFCGNNVPPTINAMGSIWIYFKSTKADVGALGQKKKGFMARYSLNHENEVLGEHGLLYSPLYPEYYVKTTTFWWRIRVKFGHKIRLTAKEFFLGYEEEMCYYGARLTVYDGYDIDAPSEIFCGAKGPNFESSSNILYVEATFESRNERGRFILEWTQIDHISTYIKPSTPNLLSNKTCGNTDTVLINASDPFLLTSPGYPGGYKRNLNCEWTFSTSSQNHLGIRFNDLRLINGINCLFDKVLIYSGTDDTEETAWNLVKTACLPNETYQEFPTSHLMRVSFLSNSFSNSSGFQASIAERCGGNIKSSNGIIKINERSSVPNDECQWNVTVRSGKTIEVSFKKFDLGSSSDDQCNNYLILKNGQYSDSPFLGEGKYCGKNAPKTLKTASNHLYVKLHSTAVAKTPGFILEFKEVSIDCGGRLTLTNFENSTIINSPNYPNIPQPHIECIWIITAPPGESIRVDFLERFDLTNRNNCEDEYIELRDGGAVTSKFIGRFCDEMPSTQTTTDNVVFVKFFTQVEDPRNGFKAKVQIKTCGGVIRSITGQITSPNYGMKDFYPKNIECIWEIIGPRDHYLNITFQEIDLAGRYEVCKDVGVKIFENFLKNLTQIVDACQMKPELKNIQTFGNHVTVKFTSGKGIGTKRAGFSLSFVTDQDVCGGKLTSPSGYIESPGYPVMNHHQRICKWNIEVPRGRRIKVKILDLDLDRSSHNYEQGIVFFNDHDFYSEIEYLSAGDSAEYVYSTDNIMAIYFWSSHVSSHRGFKLHYTSDEPTLCVGDFTKEYGTIYTPQNITLFRCSWNRDDGINLQRTVTLKITSNVADRKPVRNCGTVGTNLDIKTKVNGVIVLVAEYCNFLKTQETLRIPYPYISIINTQTVGYFESINFTVQYSTQNCGGIITEPIGTIRSPEYPNTPGRTYDCVWVIDLLENQAVKLNFTSMDLGKDCEKSFVKIHNGPLKTSPKIGTFCGNSLPPTYISQSKGIWIEYYFDAASNGKGFQVEYEPAIGGCGGIFYDTNRFLQTPDYPNEYPNDIECVWELHTTDGYHIGLVFDKRFHLENSNNCENDYVKIYDYDDDDWKLISILCGKEPPNFVNSTSKKMKVVFRSNSKISQSGFRASWRANCGGHFIADKNSRTITSPGYPNNYKSNMYCVYNITSKTGNIQAEFTDFNLEHGDDNCIFDNVTLSYKFYKQFINTTYCSTTLPPLMSVEKNLIITFRTDNFLNRRGFVLTYTTDECGGEITEPTTIKSDKLKLRSSPYRYYGKRPCVWNITAPGKSQVVVVRLESLMLKYTFNCTANYLALFDGLTNNYNNRLAIFCGNFSSIINPENTPVIRSSSNQMSIVYRDLSIGTTNFKALVYFSYGPSAGCGGRTYLNNTKTATIYGPNSLHDLDCHYEIETMDGYYLSLKFIELDGCTLNVSGSVPGNCSCSFFEIRDGGGPLAEIIDTFCDQATVPIYKSTGSRIWIRWKTNVFNIGRGFKLEVTPLLSVCGPSFLFADKTQKILQSPNYPLTYPSGIKCSWNIVLPSNVSCCMHLKFTKFDLGDVPEDSTTCTGDKVEIIERHSSDSDERGLGSSTIFATKLNNKFIGRMFYSPSGIHQYCGKSGHEYDYYAFSREATIDFESFSGIHGKGFTLQYKIDKCNRTLTGQQGKVKTTVEGSGCTILITAPTGTTVSVYFYNYYIPSRMACEDDKIEIYDGPSTTSPKLAMHCARNPTPAFSTQNIVLIQVTKRPNVMPHMLEFTYTSTDKGQGCGGKIFNYHGTFTSPMYPQNYPNISDCLWEISVPYGLDMELQFSQFSIPDRCDTDYLEVTTYSNQVKNEHRYCGNDVPPKLRSSKKMLVRYVTSFHSGAIGWAATFGAIVNQPNSKSIK